MKTKLRQFFVEILWIFPGLCLVFSITCLKYDLVNTSAWSVPTLYQDDALYWLACFKNILQGECLPFTSFEVSRLGAPFSANWNDFPLSLPSLMWPGGALSQLFDLGAASNILLISAHLTSTLFMYVCLRLVGCLRIWACVFSICFGLAPFLFTRGFTHIMSTFSSSVPISLALGFLIYRNGSSFLSGWRLFFVLFLSFYMGGVFPYYTAFYLMVMAFAGLYCFCSEKKFSCLWPFVLVVLFTFANFLLLTEPFRAYSREHGSNEFALSRFYSNLQVSALRPVELFLPGSSSQVPVLKQLSVFYENQDIFRNKFSYSESMMAYMGLPAIFGFCMLMGMTVFFIFTRKQQMISGWFWVVFFFMSFAVVGGLNGILGLGKFFLLRSSNRVSIYIVAACLFFLALLLTRFSKKISLPLRVFIALVLVGLAVLEALPTGKSLRAYNEKIMNSDYEMVAKLETDLPHGAMIFNYPVIDFPESGSYSFLRPYLFSKDLRFSAGSVKGRSRESWQHETENLPPLEMIAKLQKIGFSGILVYKGDSVSEELREKSHLFLGAVREIPNSKFESTNRDFVFIRLTPDEAPRLPKIKPQFLSTWWLQGICPGSAAGLNFPSDARWCAQKTGEVEVFNEADKPQGLALSGSLFSPSDAKIHILLGKETLKTVVLNANTPEPISIQLPSLKPGASRVIFRTDASPTMDSGRKFSFALALEER